MHLNSNSQEDRELEIDRWELFYEMFVRLEKAERRARTFSDTLGIF